LFGKWEGDRDWKKLPVSNELAARAFAAVNLELKPNGNFILIDGGIPFTGSWVRTGDTIRLDIETYFNKSVGSQPEEVRNLMEFSLRTDGTSLWYRSKSDSKSLKFKKVKLVFKFIESLDLKRCNVSSKILVTKPYGSKQTAPNSA
jgi:hypothetical protein